MGQNVMKSVIGKELSKMLNIDNLEKGIAYDKVTNLDDIYFSANEGVHLHLSKLRNVQPDKYGVLKLDFYDSQDSAPKDKIFSCCLKGLVGGMSKKQAKFNQVQNDIQAFFNAADKLIQEYFD